MCNLCNLRVGESAELMQTPNAKLAGEPICLLRTEQGYELGYEGLTFLVKYCPLCGERLEGVE